MAKVFVTPNNPDHDQAVQKMKHLASVDRHGEHQLAQTPEEADLILFAATAAHDPFFKQLRRNTLLQRYPAKCRVFCESDYAIPFVSGVYACVEKPWFSPKRHRTGPYINMYQNDSVQHQPASGEEPYLYSFVGDSQTHRCREQVLALEDKRALLTDTHKIGLEIRKSEDPSKQQAYEQNYANNLRDSKFVLCPRGLSVSSVRMYDTLKTGRVPVIVSDDWVPPSGPEWSTFCLFVKENCVREIPQILRDAEADFPCMASASHQAYLDWFDERVLFHRIINWSLATQPSRGWYNIASIRAILSRKHFKRFMRSQLQRLKSADKGN